MPTCDHYCGICGKHETGSWDQPCVDELQEAGLCFHCSFWQPKISAAANRDPNAVRVKGVHYWIGDESSRARWFRGFAGQRFRIRFHDGREVTTTNLWCQGAIPERFRPQLPDNAEFISDDREDA